jgi:hypothetical protein
MMVIPALFVGAIAIAMNTLARLARRARQGQLQTRFHGECEATVAVRQHAFTVFARDGCCLVDWAFITKAKTWRTP